VFSVFTALTAAAQNLAQLVIIRGCVGMGTGAFNVIAPVMLADFFPISERNLAYGLMALAVPIGGALGFALGAVLGDSVGWRGAFILMGIPGMVFAFAMALVNDPPKGCNDVVEPSENGTKVSAEIASPAVKQSNTADIVEILTNKAYLCSVLGLTANNFALAGLADWLPAYLYRYNGVALEEAGSVVGAAVVIGGIGGTLLGAKSAQYFEQRVKSAFFLIPAIYTIPAGFFFLLVVNIPNAVMATYFFIFMSMVFVWTCLAPLGAVTVNVLKPELRSLAGGLASVIAAVFGSIISPPLIGTLSDSSSLRTALQLVWIVTFISGAIWFAGFAFLDPLPTGVGAEEGAPTSFKEFLFGTPSSSQSVKKSVTSSGNDDTEIVFSPLYGKVPTSVESVEISEASRTSSSPRWTELYTPAPPVEKPVAKGSAIQGATVINPMFISPYDPKETANHKRRLN
jgi:MFS family permease